MEDNYQKPKREEKIAVIGMGYVGFPLAMAFAQTTQVVGFDNNEKKIEGYQLGSYPTQEEIQSIGENLSFTCQEEKLENVDIFIIAVPTPVTEYNIPDFEPLRSSSQLVGRHLRKGGLVIYESTVYPGATEEICIPILEENSGLCCREDFEVGYSPERINPGDPIHKLCNIVKIVSATSTKALERVAMLYESVLEHKVYKASSIAVAEAAKVAENSQRDVNIAFMNELAVMMHILGIDSTEVIEAMKTKWNSLPFCPGLVGGHCIGVDPYYLMNKMEQLGYHNSLMNSARQVNETIPEFVAQQLIDSMIQTGIKVEGAKVLVLGITFKENCADIRNSKVNNIVQKLNQYGVATRVYDPCADSKEVMKEYGIQLMHSVEEEKADALLVAVAHKEFCQFDEARICRFYVNDRDKQKLIFDIKGIYRKQLENNPEFRYWSL